MLNVKLENDQSRLNRQEKEEKAINEILQKTTNNSSIVELRIKADQIIKKYNIKSRISKTKIYLAPLKRIK